MANEPEGMSTLATFDTLTEGELACGLLQSAGLAAVLDDHDLFHGVTDALPAEGAVRLLVPDAQLDDAQRLLQAAQQSGGATDADVQEAASGA